MKTIVLFFLVMVCSFNSTIAQSIERGTEIFRLAGANPDSSAEYYKLAADEFNKVIAADSLEYDAYFYAAVIYIGYLSQPVVGEEYVKKLCSYIEQSKLSSETFEEITTIFTARHVYSMYAFLKLFPNGLLAMGKQGFEDEAIRDSLYKEVSDESILEAIRLFTIVPEYPYNSESDDEFLSNESIADLIVNLYTLLATRAGEKNDKDRQMELLAKGLGICESLSGNESTIEELESMMKELESK